MFIPFLSVNFLFVSCSFLYQALIVPTLYFLLFAYFCSLLLSLFRKFVEGRQITVVPSPIYDTGECFISCNHTTGMLRMLRMIWHLVACYMFHWKSCHVSTSINTIRQHISWWIFGGLFDNSILHLFLIMR